MNLVLMISLRVLKVLEKEVKVQLYLELEHKVSQQDKIDHFVRSVIPVFLEEHTAPNRPLNHIERLDILHVSLPAHLGIMSHHAFRSFELMSSIVAIEFSFLCLVRL